jgi:predicted AAA+ superfamily ATPase
VGAVELLPRKALQVVADALADTRVVAINGARQVGKSTLARVASAGAPGRAMRLLDDAATLRAALDDPAGFVQHDSLMVIDEIQLAPDLFRAIKVAVDTDPRPGQFLLTGSAQILALRDLPDALPGRMEVIELWPFSQGELGGGADRFVDAVFTHGPAVRRTSALRKRDYLELAVRGGYPEAVRRSPRRRAAFFDSYLATMIERDVRQLSVIERRGELRRLLTLLAGRSGGLLVPAALATQAGLPAATLRRYLDLLAAVFLIKEIPAWSGGPTQRAIGTPKLSYVDTGIAAHLLGQDAARLNEPGGAAGAVLETFVLTELARQLTWNDQRARLYHYRTKDKVEVDAVLEAADGRVVAVEVKAGATVHSQDLAGLRHLESRLGDRFIAGFILYTGQQTLPFGDRLRAMPLDALWRIAP